MGANNLETYTYPPGTLYAAWKKHIQHAMVQSQIPAYRPMPTDKFADTVVSALVTKTGRY